MSLLCCLFFICFVWTWVIRYGVLFLPPIQAVFRPPLESACYHNPISNLLPAPLFSPLSSSSSSSSSFLVALGTDSSLPAHCHQTMSAFMCRRKHPQIHRHTVTPTQTRFVGFPRVKHSSVSALCFSPLTKMIFAQPVGFAGQLFTQCEHLYLKTIKHNAPQPCSHGSGGCGVNLKQSERQMAADVWALLSHVDTRMFAVQW